MQPKRSGSVISDLWTSDPSGTRTHNLSLDRGLLLPLSYEANLIIILQAIRSTRRTCLRTMRFVLLLRMQQAHLHPPTPARLFSSLRM